MNIIEKMAKTDRILFDGIWYTIDSVYQDINPANKDELITFVAYSNSANGAEYIDPISTFVNTDCKFFTLTEIV